MAKLYMKNISDFVNKTYNQTDLDEKIISNYLTKNLEELKTEFKAIDDEYDRKWDRLHKDFKKLYADWINEKKERIEFLERLIFKEDINIKIKEELIKEWLCIKSEIDALISDNMHYLEKYEKELKEKEENKRKKTMLIQITKASIPVVVKGILGGLSFIAMRSNISPIDTTQKITKK